MGRRSRLFLCMWNRICIFVDIVVFSADVYIFHNGAVSEVVFQNCQVTGKMDEGEMKNEK